MLRQAILISLQEKVGMGGAASREARLLAASHNGNEEAVDALLKEGKVNVNTRDQDGWTPLHRAASKGHASVVALLLAAKADPKAEDKVKRTPLHEACFTGRALVVVHLLAAKVDLDALDKNRSRPLRDAVDMGHVAVVELLLKANARVNEDANEESPVWSALHWACRRAHVRVVELLLAAHANPNAADQDGRTPLHVASINGHVEVAELLLAAGNVSVNAIDRNGHTPLHLACVSRKSDVARLLLTYGANVHAEARNGFQPMRLVIRSPGSLINSTLVLQALVSFGAAWDPAWDKGKKDQDEYHHALRICVDHWVQQHKKRRAFTSVPVDVLTAGADRTQAYLSTHTMSEVTLRRMLCVVGARGAGKTSLVTSIASDSVPRMEETPTIGINRLALRRFEQVVDDAKRIEIHDVSVWDFGGRDTFHAANALFVPPRAVFLVCVDLAAFSTAFMQAAILADTREQEVMLLDEFIETAVRRFVRTILKRQCDVDFVFAVTKQDLLARERDRVQDELKQTLVAKLNGIERLVHDIQRDLLQNNEETVAIPKLFASCMSPDSIDDARTTIERFLKSSRHRSVEILDTHMRALDLLRQRALDPKDRVARAFVGVSGVADKLEMDPQRCRALMRELYTLGEILYFEQLVDVEFFSTTVIMEPLLLMDFIRPVLEYAPFTNQILSHAELETLPYWRDVRDNRQLKAIKQLLHRYDVVFPATADLNMETNSDLIVPASWQTKPPASWLFLGDILRLTSAVGVGAALADRLASTSSPLDEAVRVHWEFCFASSGLPTPFFDRLIVAIVSANCTVKWDAGPDWIVHRDESKTTACRLMVGRDPQSHLRTMELEAVVAHAATASHTSVLWTRFLQLLRAFVKVRRDMPEAVVASSVAWECRGTHTIDLERLAEFAEVPSSWMPPAETWAQCKELLTKP